MKLVIEEKEFEFVANGSFMKKYQELFKENLIMALYHLSQEKDCFTCAKLIYAGINTEVSFDDWLNSFDSPIFTINVMDSVMEYLTRVTTPTVESLSKEETDVKKKIA